MTLVCACGFLLYFVLFSTNIHNLEIDDFSLPTGLTKRFSYLLILEIDDFGLPTGLTKRVI